jgi:hypothetical protein
VPAGRGAEGGGGRRSPSREVLPHCAHERGHVLTQRGKGERHHRSLRREQIRTAGAELIGIHRHCGAEPSPGSIALHRGTEATADGVGHLRRVVGSVGEEAQRDGTGPLPVGPREGRERRTVADAPDQAERRFRPRARRARSTARPPLVRMRRRNPWVLARLRLFGWYVRFNEEPPRGAARSPRSGTAREAETAKCTARNARFATRRDLWGKRPRPLVAQGRPVLRCALRSATARRRDFPGVSPLDQADTSTTVGTISTPVDVLVDNLRRRRTRPDRRISSRAAGGGRS